MKRVFLDHWNRITDVCWHSKLAQSFILQLQEWFNSRRLRFLIIAVALLSTILSLQAYAPADGADGTDYFMHAAYLAGYDVPATFEAHPPIYPILILLFFFQTDQIYILIAVQLILSIAQPLILFEALRPHSLPLAVITSLVVTLDMQTRILFNFVSTEPIYIFLMSATFSLAIFQMEKSEQRMLGDTLLAILIVLTGLTRSVGLYLIVPFGFVFLLKTRSLKRLIILLLAYFVGSQIFNFAYQNIFQLERVTANTESESLLMQPIMRSGLAVAENGPATSEIFNILSTCDDVPPYSPCIIEAKGSRQSANRLIRDAYVELVTTHPISYLQDVLKNITSFLRLSSLQYTGDSPSVAQCIGVQERTDRNFERYLTVDVATRGDIVVNERVFYDILLYTTKQMCPPLSENETVREIVDWIAFRYRSIARPQPWLWMIALVFFMISLPFARKFWAFALLAMMLNVYHATISAALYNIQPRYAAVTNVFRVVIIMTTLYILMQFFLHIFDYWQSRRERSLS
ncbi:MAG: hypothetical protein ACFE0Q_02500 [Anaerolineae bacterium]